MTSKGDQAELENMLVSIDLNINHTDRFFIEFSHAALKSSRPDMAIDALSRLKDRDDKEALYLRFKALIMMGEYKQALNEFQNANGIHEAFGEFLVLGTFLSLIVNVLNLESQVLDVKNREEILPIRTTEEALDYILNVDATHPHAWLLISNKNEDELVSLGEPEFYATFGAFLGHGRLLYKLAFRRLVGKIYYGPNADRGTLSVILIALVEDALTYLGESFVNTMMEDLAQICKDEAVLSDIVNLTQKIIKKHSKKERNRLTSYGDGFIGNVVYFPSILNND